MPNIGPLELAIVLIIALVVFGPTKLPELGKSLGKGMREFKSSMGGDDAGSSGDAESDTDATERRPALTATAETAPDAERRPEPAAVSHG